MNKNNLIVTKKIHLYKGDSIETILSRIPHGISYDEVVLRYNLDYDHGDIFLCLEYKILETDEERDKRIASEERQKQWEIQKEKRQYEYLKAKYESQ